MWETKVSAICVPLGTLHSTFKMESLRKAAWDTQEGQLVLSYAIPSVMAGWPFSGNHTDNGLEQGWNPSQLQAVPLSQYFSTDVSGEETEAKGYRTAIRGHETGAAVASHWFFFSLSFDRVPRVLG